LVWVVGGGGAPTLAERRRREADDLRARAALNPLVAAALAAFPGAEIKAVRPVRLDPPEPAPDASDAPPLEAYDADALSDDWAPVDPFDEE
jgi:DNA polymerase-3 subunit gamma/tau